MSELAFKRVGEDGRTIEQCKTDFLKHFAENGNVTLSCKNSRVGRSTVYTWLEDTAFKAAFDDAEKASTELMEAEAWRRASKGVKKKKGYYYLGQRVGEDVVTEYSDTLMMFLLKAREPKKYRDNSSVEVSGPGGAPMQSTMALDVSKLSVDQLKAAREIARAMQVEIKDKES